MEFRCKYFWNSDVNIIGSEYLGYDKKPGEIINNLRHEDALNLSFENESIDIIVSNDVYEHVPDIKKVIQESYRVLKNKGKVIFTVPFYCFENEIKQRALIKNKEIINLMPAQFHDNPISEKGSLVFYDFGWDLLNLYLKLGFKDVYALTYYSLFYGYLGQFQIMFVAEK